VPVVKARQQWAVTLVTHDKAKTLISELPEHLKPVVTFALATGLRRSNILDLEWSQVDMQRRMAWIHPENVKGGRAIGVALNDTACGVLRGKIGKHYQWVFVHAVSTVQEMGGWESIEMVRRYAHLSPVHLTQHAKQIDSIFIKNGTNTAQWVSGEIRMPCKPLIILVGCGGFEPPTNGLRVNRT